MFIVSFSCPVLSICSSVLSLESDSLSWSASLGFRRRFAFVTKHIKKMIIIAAVANMMIPNAVSVSVPGAGG